ncbi:hypothetical protein ACFSL4_01505 [Streptomyces caeni]|uniref:Uncharacterized protein n=1 Tax=Streptomyces caeni TaxID=2307231 RepID=A0ABW4IHZ7_9ACTN
MTATLHIARRTTPHHNPLAAFTGWLTGRLRRRPLPAATPDVTALDLEALRLSLPLDDPDRHLLENPAVEDAFAHLAVDHPAEVTVSCMRAADREELLLAACDAWFHHVHPAPEHRWSPEVRAEHALLLASVRACFPPGGVA